MFKIMIVDNEAAIRKGLAHCIRWEDLDCIVATQAEDGLDALERIPLVQPDIVISDIRMPEMDGLELARQLCEHYPHIKTIILSGFPDFEYAQRAIEYRVVDFVLKPTSVEALTMAIEKAKDRIAQESSNLDLALKLADQSEQNLLLQRGILLHDLMNRISFSQTYVRNRLTQLDLDLTGYYVLRLEIFPLLQEEANPLLYLAQSQSVLADCLSSYTVHFAPWGDQMCFAVVCSSEIETLADLCREAVDIINSLTRFSLHIGISSYYKDPMGVADAANESCQAIHIAQYSEDQPVVSFSQMPVVTPQTRAHVFENLKLLKSAIENKNANRALEIFAKLFQYIKENKIPNEDVRNICIYIHQFCINLLFSPGEEDFASETSMPVLKRLLEVSSVDILEKNMLGFITHMLERTASENASQGGLIQNVKKYIAHHYCEDLSLESLASLAYLSPSYLSKLFKRETGENLSTYIQIVRINEAKTLLLTTQLKTYEVADRVGIPDPVYFSRIFKKIVGVKPKDFRNKKETDSQK